MDNYPEGMTDRDWDYVYGCENKDELDDYDDYEELDSVLDADSNNDY